MFTKKAFKNIVLSSLGCLGFLFIVGCGGGGGLGKPQPTGTVSGYVQDVERNYLPSVTVNAGGASGTTDANGRFEFGGVRTGNQTVTASKSGYFNNGTGSTPVVVAENASVSAGTLYLLPSTGNEVLLKHVTASTTSFNGYGTATIAGTQYFDSLVENYMRDSNTTESALFPISGKYSIFRANVGVQDDTTALGYRAEFAVIGDGNVLYQSTPMALNTSASIEINVSGVNVLQLTARTFDGYSYLNNNGGYNSHNIAFGRPRLVPKTN